MKNIEIYRDENTIVEIDGLFNAFLKAVIIRTVKLRKEQYKILLEDTLDKLREKGWDFRSFISLKASSSVPVIELNKKINLIEPFDVFECVFDLFASITDLSIKDEVIKDLENYEEKEIPFFIEFYDKPIFNVSGVVAAKLENLLLISFFKMDENNRENY
jgi:hypothetical protein